MYFKVKSNGYILGLGIGSLGEQITEEEFNELTEIFHNVPVREGYHYNLREDLTWEEVKDVPELIDEPTPEELIEVGKIMLGL